jgi:hypothetical protein
MVTTWLQLSYSNIVHIRNKDRIQVGSESPVVRDKEELLAESSC